MFFLCNILSTDLSGGQQRKSCCCFFSASPAQSLLISCLLSSHLGNSLISFYPSDSLPLSCFPHPALFLIFDFLHPLLFLLSLFFYPSTQHPLFFSYLLFWLHLPCFLYLFVIQSIISFVLLHLSMSFHSPFILHFCLASRLSHHLLVLLLLPSITPSHLLPVLPSLFLTLFLLSYFLIPPNATTFTFLSSPPFLPNHSSALSLLVTALGD